MLPEIGKEVTPAVQTPAIMKSLGKLSQDFKAVTGATVPLSKDTSPEKVTSICNSILEVVVMAF